VGAPLACWSERLRDGSQHALAVGKDFVVPKPENTPALPPQFAVAQVVVTGASMLAAIGFDDQARLNASKIDDVRRYRELASKSPAKPVFAEFFP
jgi:hypothetical protein